MKVSVVAAMYNAGQHVRELVACLDAQTLPQEEFELIVVDDGSTDDTLAIARELAATHPNMVVETIPNSGWPGRPRNVGTERARGEYLLYIDHDDRLGPRALEKMYAMAAANGSDIVYGKIVRRGRDTPYWPLWQADQPHADVAAAAASRTVHKLFRSAFLREHGIRFSEGKVRLEDHRFMAEALPRARVVSVLASEPCYFWIYQAGENHISDTPAEPADYWRDYAQVLATWEAAGGPAELLSAARLSALNQAFARFPASRYLQLPPEGRTALFTAVRRLVTEQFPAELEPRLAVLRRLRTSALRAGDQERFDAVQELRSRLTFTTGTERVEVRDGRLEVTVTAACTTTDGDAVPLDVRDGRVLLPIGSIEADDADRVLLDADRGAAEVTIRHRSTGVEWPVPNQTCTRGDGLSVRVQAAVGLTDDPFGARLDGGTWDLLVRVQFLGENTIRRVGAHPGDDQEQRPPAPAFATANDLLSFKVTAPRPPVQSVAWVGRRLKLTLAGDGTVVAGPRGAGTQRRRYALTAGTVEVPLDEISEDGSGLVDFWLEDAEGGEPIRIAYDGPDRSCHAPGRTSLNAYATAYQSLSVRRAPQPKGAGPVLQVVDRLSGVAGRLGRRGR